VAGLARGAPGLEAAARVDAVGDRLRLAVSEKDLGRVVLAVEAAKGRVLSVQPVRQSLEDYFFREMGGSRSEGGAWDEA
jgi:hypothetical protein